MWNIIPFRLCQRIKSAESPQLYHLSPSVRYRDLRALLKKATADEKPGTYYDETTPPSTLEQSIGVQWHTLFLDLKVSDGVQGIFETYRRYMKTQFEQLMQGLNDVEAFLAGEQEGFKAHVPHDVDVKAIRTRLGMTQARFSDTFGFSLDAIKHWEGGRRTPEAPARTLLTVIDKNPAAVITALHPKALPKATTKNAAKSRVKVKKQIGRAH